MEAYKFEVTVRENGIIEIPEISQFANQEVEIFIMIKPIVKLKAGLEKNVDNFLDKWRGTLKDVDRNEFEMGRFNGGQSSRGGVR